MSMATRLAVVPFSSAKVAVAVVTSSGPSIGNVPVTESTRPADRPRSTHLGAVLESGPPLASSVELQLFHQPQANSGNNSGVTELLGLNAEERLQFVQKTAKVLFMAEYVVLIEYTEVVTPVIYCAYILLMFHLPNREYYPQLVSTSSEKLTANLLNVLLYASVELLSFLAIGWILKRKLGVTRTHQLTFVLTTQWRTVQSKFGLWVVYIIQSYLFHAGADFSFQFKWLHSDSGPSESVIPPPRR